MTTPPALQLADLRCERGGRVLFSGLDVTVPAGHQLRVRGDNGAGKTSLLRLVCGLARADAGSVRWRGHPIAAWGEDFRSQCLYLGHAAALKDEVSALENLHAALALAGHASTAAQRSAALAQAGLADTASQRAPVRRLSQGQRQRAALARLVLSAAVPLWVLDEPFNTLDTAAVAWLQGQLGAQLARGGVVVLTSHLQTDWENTMPRVTVHLRQALAEAACS